MATINEINAQILSETTTATSLRNGIENNAILNGVELNNDTPNSTLTKLNVSAVKNNKDLGNYKKIIERSEENGGIYVVPSGITKLGKYSLYSNDNTRTIDLSECNIESIDDFAIGDCLDIIAPQNDVVEISSLAFSPNITADSDKYFCNGKWVQLSPSSTTSKSIDSGTELIIGNDISDTYHQSITSLSLPNTLKGICKGGLSSYGISSFTAPATLKSLQKSALSNCQSLAYIDLQYATNLLEIGEECFKDCNAILSVEFSPNIKTIRKKAFYNIASSVSSSSLNINIVNTIEKIEDYAFAGDGISYAGIKTLTISGNNTKLTEIPLYCFQYNTQLTTVDFGTNLALETISGHAFMDCTSLTTISIPEGVKDVSWYAFYECTNLTTVDLPSTLKNIGSACFSYTNLTTLNFAGTMAQWGEMTFGNSNWHDNSPLTTVHCSDGDITL